MPKKLIEVALPLEEINRAAAREKSIRHGHPSTLHLWWARRPLAACRAVLFAQLVDDPSSHPDQFPTEEAQEQERKRLFGIIENLVKWENSNNEAVLAAARAEIVKSCDGNPPAVLDPFCGGGSIPLEAQRLGLKAYASDLNPVAVLITKALIEIPPKFANKPPVNPAARSEWRAERSEGRGERSEREGGGAERALQGDDRLGQGDGGGAGGLPFGARPAARGNVRDALATNQGCDLDSGQHRGRLDAGIEPGEGAVPGDRSRFAGGDGDPSDAVRRSRMVSSRADPHAALAAGRGQPNFDHDAAESEERSEGREVRNESHAASPSHSSLLFTHSYYGAQGLAEDVRYYGKWMRDEAEKRIGHLYPKVKVTAEMAKHRDDLKGLVGKELTVIAWLWVRTVKCPNPACGAMMPLVRSFWLSTKKGKEAWVEPLIDKSANAVRFTVKRGNGKPPESSKTGRGAKFRCLICLQATEDQHVKDEGAAKRMGTQLMAVVAEGSAGRVYLAPSEEQERTAYSAKPKWSPGEELPYEPRAIWCTLYGLKTYRDLFTARQLVALTTFSDLVGEARERVLKDARASGMPDDGKGIDEGGLGATAYADAIATYLAFAVDKGADYWSTVCSWNAPRDGIRDTFARQAIPMVWDFAEANPLSDSSGNFSVGVEQSSEMLMATPASAAGFAKQLDATAAVNGVASPVVSTDPPYYDNIGYADLSDFFYVWLRRSVGKIYPQLFSTLLVPKAQELVATPYRFQGSKEKAQRFFEEGLGKAFAQMRQAHNSEYPLTVFYAFKQAEEEENEDDNFESSSGLVSTGWETMLEGLIRAGFQITGTWPMRTERGGRSISVGANALASSVVLACRPRADDAPLATRREFVEALRNELPAALKNLQHGSIAPVDLAQAAIGPGMAVFSRYSKVLETDGSPMRVRTALGLINQALDEILAEQEGEYDAETRWALAWFEQYGMNMGKFGDAETLSRAKDTAVNALEEAGIVTAKVGKVQLVAREGLNPDWDPASEKRLTVWELTQHLIRALEIGGDAAAARIIRRVGSLAETAKDLAYRLYVICDRKGWSQEALAYNMLVKSWPELQKLAAGSEGESARLL
jgi:putative DNA methylase